MALYASLCYMVTFLSIRKSFIRKCALTIKQLHKDLWYQVDRKTLTITLQLKTLLQNYCITLQCNQQYKNTLGVSQAIVLSVGMLPKELSAHVYTVQLMVSACRRFTDRSQMSSTCKSYIIYIHTIKVASQAFEEHTQKYSNFSLHSKLH